MFNKRKLLKKIKINQINSIHAMLIISAVLIIFSLMISNYLNSTYYEKQQQNETVADQDVVKNVDVADTPDINEIGINENKNVYEEDDPGSIVYFYVTVRRGEPGSKTDHSFAEVNSAEKFKDGAETSNEDIFSDAIVQVGDENGPLSGMLGYNATEANATINKRGNSSSEAVQSSYSLKLKKNSGMWRGEKNIALNKHAYDRTRIKNKLYFDLLKDVPEVPSLRTQFVRLFVKDETDGKKEFDDYGVYTQVEMPNKTYLSNHGLDSSGYLYKAKLFNFEMNESIKNFDDPDFDEKEFNKILECKGKRDNEKFINLIEEINDTGNDINDVIDKYFDRDNYENWLAYNILIGNFDTNMQNFYLYSPLNSDKWYFISWDGDGSLTLSWDKIQNTERPDYQKGIANYFGVSLHRRFLKDDKNREELRGKVDYLKSIITSEKVNNLLNIYTTSIDKYVTAMPDILYLEATVDERNYLLDLMADEIEKNYEDFNNNLNDIMPFFLDEPIKSENGVEFKWGDAYDFKNEIIKYNFKISKNLDMSNPIYDIDNYENTSISIPTLEKGTYYWTVSAISEDGRQTNPYDYIEIDKNKYFGIKKVVV